MIKQLKNRPKELKGLKPILINKADSYFMKIEFFIKGADVYVSLSSVIEKTWFVITGYEEYTAVEIIEKVEWGRHFEDGILELWKMKRLDFGYAKSIFKK